MSSALKIILLFIATFFYVQSQDQEDYCQCQKEVEDALRSKKLDDDIAKAMAKGDRDRLLEDSFHFYSNFEIPNESNDDRYEKFFLIARNTSKNWFEARRVCQHYGMDLLTLATETEADFMFGRLKHLPLSFWSIEKYGYAYIGGIRVAKHPKNEWYWDKSGEKIDYRMHFAKDHLDGSGNCLAIKIQGKEYGFDDLECNCEDPKYEGYSFICQDLRNSTSNKSKKNYYHDDFIYEESLKKKYYLSSEEY